MKSKKQTISNCSDLKIEILYDGWTTIICNDIKISLGKYPNKRFEVLEKMFKSLGVK